MQTNKIAKLSAFLSFGLCLLAGLWILVFEGIDTDGALGTGIGFYFLGKAFFVGPSLLLDSARKITD